MAETTNTPELDFAIGSWSATSWTGAHAVHIGATGVACPDVRFTLQAGSVDIVMLLDAQIPDRVALAFQCCQQLQAVVLQCLSPLRVAGSDRQHPASKT